jgi:predicted alpha-1,2-mannosidase
MVGDSADPLIADAAAFGAAAFDRRAALAAMLKGAEAPCRSPNGEYVERQGLESYLAHGYVPYDLDTNVRDANSIYGSPEAVWGSAATSLEYDVDDFAIAQFAARALHDRSVYGRFMRRSGNWRKLFDRSSGQIEPRYENGSFPANYDNLGGAGFVEGDSAQYTWMVPHDPAGLFREMGGRVKASARLGRFLRELNGSVGGTHTDHALLGNEPTLHAPWLYDWAGRPYATEEAVRRALRLYSTTPDGYPGNDDLGTLSSWYVFAALGLYPEVPGVGVLAIGSPLFGQATISMPHHRTVKISAAAYTFKRSKRKGGKHSKPGKPRRVPLSPASAPYVRSLSVNGHAYGRPWTTYCTLARGKDLAFQLGPRPNRGWGSAAAAAPPSFGPHRPIPKSACAP